MLPCYFLCTCYKSNKRYNYYYLFALPKKSKLENFRNFSIVWLRIWKSAEFHAAIWNIVQFQLLHQIQNVLDMYSFKTIAATHG